MLGITLCHGGAKEAVERHMPNWLKCFSEMLFICPSDDPIDGGVSVGTSCHHGEGSIERMKIAVAVASCNPFTSILEYDTLCWNLMDFAGASGRILCSRVMENGDDQFGAAGFGHSPWCATSETWKNILAHGEDAQGGWPDRWLALAAQKAGVRLEELPNSFSYDATWTNDIVKIAQAVRTQNPYAIHGFKDPAIYELLK